MPGEMPTGLYKAWVDNLTGETEELKDEISVLRDEILTLTAFMESDENDHYSCFMAWSREKHHRERAEGYLVVIKDACQAGDDSLKSTGDSRSAIQLVARMINEGNARMEKKDR